MKEQNVLETLSSKRAQIMLAVQLTKMILKIDDIRGNADQVKILIDIILPQLFKIFRTFTDDKIMDFNRNFMLKFEMFLVKEF